MPVFPVLHREPDAGGAPRRRNVDVEPVCSYLREGGHFRMVGVEPDGTIEISTAERKPGDAKELVASCLDDEDRQKFIIGEPPW